MRTEKVFPRARTNVVCTSREPLHLIIGIGQMHPVLRGRFGWLQARTIGSVQAWIFHACHALHTRFGIETFGQEGFSESDGLTQARVGPHVLTQVQIEIGTNPNGADDFLKGVANRWRKALRKNDMPRVASESTLLNGLTVLQAVDPDVTLFPIEDSEIHSGVGKMVEVLHKELESVTASDTYQRAQSKGGKNLTQSEYDAVIRHNEIVKAYNKALASPERDRAIFEAIGQQAKRDAKRYTEGRDQPLCTVFILGQAHRHSFLHLAKQCVPSRALFVWVTPAPLLFFIRLRQIALVIFGLVIIGILIWFGK